MISKGVFGLLTPQEWRDMNNIKFQQLLPCTLILKGKYNADNEFQKVKARLVVLGNLQRAKFEELFNKSTNESPTVWLTGLFSVLMLAAKKGIRRGRCIPTCGFKRGDIHEIVQTDSNYSDGE